MNRFALLPIVALLSAPALAAPETYIIDNNHTLPRFSYSHMGYSIQLSRFDKASGKIVYDADADMGSVDVTIDMKSVDTGSTKFNEHIQSEDFLDTAKFPTASFKSTAVKFVGGRPASIEGNLTIKGVTKPVTLTVVSFQHMMHPMLKKDAIGATATTTIRRSDFNAGKYAPLVGDEVTITIPVEAQRE
jgi:polyisoprenoid-binding protein YceI